MNLLSLRFAGRRFAAGSVSPLVSGALILPLSVPAHAQDGHAGVESKTVATPIQMVDMFHSAFGTHHARAVHAKGIVLEGDFTPAPEARSLSRAAHLQGATVPIIVRFSDFTGIPNIADTVGASSPRGMAIKFKLPGAASTDLIAHSFNGFPTATTDEFRSLLLAIGANGSGNPAPLTDFLATHPIAKTFLTTQKPLSTSWATLSFFGVNAFKFTNQAGQEHYVRYQLIPDAGEHFLSKAQAAAAAPDYLQTEIKQRVARKPITFKLYAQVAEKGDVIENPSVAWPDSRKRVLLGTLVIKKMAANTAEEDKALFFNPNNVPEGVNIADQMLLDRARTYPLSVGQRQ
ncbi:catalase family peroxidase [Hymenobacter sp. BT491]|uniref:catalase family peroxidase n=1 Tax=Hymenobacter sp. BT491 TaxID=2766779 RepID=UPI001653D47F|nr:catalase family peroxidase [Hymenobacter sp. BT491]MBC6992324.1 catalase family peroxidase [Hymenobacter sp. BT491]